MYYHSLHQSLITTDGILFLVFILKPDTVKRCSLGTKLADHIELYLALMRFSASRFCLKYKLYTISDSTVNHSTKGAFRKQDHNIDVDQVLQLTTQLIVNPFHFCSVAYVSLSSLFKKCTIS